MTEIVKRIAALDSLLRFVEPVPEAWVEEAAKKSPKGGGAEIQPLECRDWRTLVSAWRKAMRWRQELDDVLSVVLAVAISTEQVGDSQLFLMLVADAGSSKSRFMQAMLVSKGCHALDHLTGFFSGSKDDSGDDFSLLSRINRKTLITSEGDVIMSNPRFAEIMSQQRQIFDGSGGATYKNMKKDRRYAGLRTPWIMAGTPALMDTDQSKLGDRFLRVWIDQPAEDERRAIMRTIAFGEMQNVEQSSNCAAESIMNPNLLLAYRLTGGYVDHLRADASGLIAKAKAGMDEESVVERCMDLAEFAANMRSRPALTRKDGGDGHDTKELPSRLTAQFTRLACCLAAVLNRGVDAEVMRRVRKVAMDTGRGKTLEMSRLLHRVEEVGTPSPPSGRKAASAERLAAWMPGTMGADRALTLLRFLKRNGVAESVPVPGHNPRWRMADGFRDLWERVMS